MKIVVERAYAEMHFHPNFNVVVGKSLSPTLWKANHYPNIVKPIAEPIIVANGVISGNYIGPMIFGDLGKGFSYNLWTSRNTANGTASIVNNGFSKFYRLGYETSFEGGNIAISYLGGTTESDDGSSATYSSTTGVITPSVAATKALHLNPTSLDLNLNVGRFTLWLESSTTTEAMPHKGPTLLPHIHLT